MFLLFCRNGSPRSGGHFFAVNGFPVLFRKLIDVFVHPPADHNPGLRSIVLQVIIFDFNSILIQATRHLDFQIVLFCFDFFCLHKGVRPAGGDPVDSDLGATLPWLPPQIECCTSLAKAVDVSPHLGAKVSVSPRPLNFDRFHQPCLFRWRTPLLPPITA